MNQGGQVRCLQNIPKVGHLLCVFRLNRAISADWRAPLLSSTLAAFRRHMPSKTIPLTSSLIPPSHKPILSQHPSLPPVQRLP